jgi:hypothetical protein
MNEPNCIVCSARLDRWNLHYHGPLCGPCSLVYGGDPSPATGEGIDISQDETDTLSASRWP